MPQLEWVSVPETFEMSLKGSLFKWLSQVVVDTLSGTEHSLQSNVRTGLVQFTPSPTKYTLQSSAAEAGRTADRYAAERFGGQFKWFTKSTGDQRYQLWIRYVPPSVPDSNQDHLSISDSLIKNQKGEQR